MNEILLTILSTYEVTAELRAPPFASMLAQHFLPFQRLTYGLCKLEEYVAKGVESFIADAASAIDDMEFLKPLFHWQDDKLIHLLIKRLPHAIGGVRLTGRPGDYLMEGPSDSEPLSAAWTKAMQDLDSGFEALFAAVLNDEPS